MRAALLETARRAAGARCVAETRRVIGANEMGNEPNEWFGHFIRAHQIRATVLEPSAQSYRNLQANFGREAYVVPLRLAVQPNRSAIEPDGTCKFWTCGGPCSQTAHLDASTREKVSHVSEYWLKKFRTRMRQVSVPCVTADALITSQHLEDVDIVTVDTEGHDFEIVKRLPLMRIRPAIVEFEAKAMTSAMVRTIVRLLKSYGYVVFDSNATPDRIHWVSKWQFLELVAFRKE